VTGESSVPAPGATTGAVATLEPMTGREAHTYQRLRAHLAALRLTAAAESLTTVLDAARDQQLSTITVLERLLGIEVAAAATRRHAGLLRFASLPAPYSIDEFDFTAQPGVDEKLIRELASLRFLDDAGNILFVGQPGTGKTSSRSASPARRSPPGIGSTSPPPPSWPNAADAPRWKDAGPPQCGSSAALGCW
jgi:hypothetical protein